MITKKCVCLWGVMDACEHSHTGEGHGGVCLGGTLGTSQEEGRRRKWDKPEPPDHFHMKQKFGFRLTCPWLQWPCKAGPKSLSLQRKGLYGGEGVPGGSLAQIHHKLSKVGSALCYFKISPVINVSVSLIRTQFFILPFPNA